MNRLKAALLGIIGAVIGIITLRRYRERRKRPRDEAEHAAKRAMDEASKAVEHSAESLSHARVAGEKAVEAAGEEFAEVRGMNHSASRSRRIRNRVQRTIRR